MVKAQATEGVLGSGSRQVERNITPKGPKGPISRYSGLG